MIPDDSNNVVKMKWIWHALIEYHRDMALSVRYWRLVWHRLVLREKAHRSEMSQSNWNLDWQSGLYLTVKFQDFGKEDIVCLTAYNRMNDQLIQTWVLKLYCIGLRKFYCCIIRKFHWLEGDVKLMYCWLKLDSNEDLICKLLWQLLYAHLRYQKTT